MWWLLVVVIDQLGKFWAARQGRVVLNDGGVWGIIPGPWWTLIILGLLLGLGGWWVKHRNTYVGLILAAGSSNFIDRLIYGGVRDYIYYPGLNVYGNIADIILLIGVGGWLWQKWRLSSKTKI